MIVIIIIGILAGLLSVAAYNAVLAARKTRVKAEIDNMGLQMQQYATDRGELPPCLGDFVNTTAGNPVRQERFIAHLRKAFPRLTVTPGTSESLSYAGPSGNTGLRKYVQTAYGNSVSGQPLNIDTIDQAEALVFWLGGPPATPGLGASTKLLGWSADVSNPFKPIGPRASGGFVFIETRLVDRDNDGWWEYAPDIASSTGLVPPYVYFDAASYEKLAVQVYPCAVDTPPYTASHKSLYLQWGVIVPYMSTYTSNPVNVKMVNPKGFQIISAGLDSIYSFEGYKGPNQPKAWEKYPLFPLGTNYKDGDHDNLTNFCPGALKDEVQ